MLKICETLVLLTIFKKACSSTAIAKNQQSIQAICVNLTLVEQNCMEQTNDENQTNNTANTSNYHLVLSDSFFYLRVYDIFHFSV
jgi:hypothetical protein